MLLLVLLRALYRCCSALHCYCYSLRLVLQQSNAAAVESPGAAVPISLVFGTAVAAGETAADCVPR